MFASTYLQVLSVYGGSVSSTGDQLFRRPRKYTSSFCFVYGGSTKKIHKFVLSTGDQFRLRGISFVYGGSVVFERLRRKNGPDRRGRRVRCGPAGRPAPGR